MIVCAKKNLLRKKKDSWLGKCFQVQDLPVRLETWC